MPTVIEPVPDDPELIAVTYPGATHVVLSSKVGPWIKGTKLSAREHPNGAEGINRLVDLGAARKLTEDEREGIPKASGVAKPVVPDPVFIPAGPGPLKVTVVPPAPDAK